MKLNYDILPLLQEHGRTVTGAVLKLISAIAASVIVSSRTVTGAVLKLDFSSSNFSFFICRTVTGAVLNPHTFQVVYPAISVEPLQELY